MAFSLCRQEIEGELAKLGVNGASAAQIAAHRSRLSKDQRDEPALKAEWRERAAALAIFAGHFFIQRPTIAAVLILSVLPSESAGQIVLRRPA